MGRPAVVIILEPTCCRVCGCTEERACDAGEGVGCSWVDMERRVCSVCALALADAWEKREPLATTTEEEIVKVCGWCAPEWVRALPNASHGICDVCLVLVRREIEEMYFGLGAAGGNRQDGPGRTGTTPSLEAAEVRP